MKHILLILLSILSSAFVLCQSNDIAINLDDTSLQFHEGYTTQHNSTQLHAVNAKFSNRMVIGIIPAADGTHYVIQENEVHQIAEDDVLRSFYFYHGSEEIRTAYFQDEATLVLLSDNHTIGYINTQDKLHSDIQLVDYDKKYVNLKLIDHQLYLIRVMDQGRQSISKASILNESLETELLYELEHRSTINDIHVAGQTLLFLDNDDRLYQYAQKTLKLLYHSEIREHLIFNQAKIIKHSSGYFIFFKYSKGLYWLNDNGGLTRCSDEGVYRYHAYDESNRLLIGLGTKPRLVNTILLVEDRTMSYFDHSIDWNAIVHVYSADFTKFQYVSGNNGLYSIKYDFERPGIERYLYNPKKQFGEFGEIILDMEMMDGDIYAISESRQGVYLLRDNAFELIHEGEKQFNRIYKDDYNDVLWINAYDQNRESSIYQIKKGEHQVRKIIDLDILLLAMVPLSADSILLCGFVRENTDYTGKILLYHPQKNKVTEIYAAADHDIWTAAKIDSTVLLGLRKGLLRYDIKTGSVSEVTEMEQHFVSSIRKIGKEIFVCTKSNGMYVFSEDMKLVEYHDLNEYPVSNKVTDIIQDDQGNYWVSTFKDIALLDEHKNLLMTINQEDGISAYEFNSGASLMTPDQQLYLGSINGITKIDIPTFYQENDNQVKAHRVVGIHDNKYVTPNTADHGFHFTFIPDKIELELMAESSLTGAAGYTKIDVLHDGVPVCTEQINAQVKISDVSTGTYTLQQKKLHGDVHQIAEISVQRNYQTLISQLLLIIVAGALSFLAARYIYQRENRIIKEKAAMNNRLVELKLESLRSQLNPHFVFNCLNSIQYYIQVNEKKLAREYLSKFSKLMRLFLESSRNETITITDEIELLTLYLELEQLRFEDKFSFHIESKIDSLTKVPPMIIQPFVENSIVHGFSHLENRSGKIDIRFSEDDQQGVICRISDNGIGRSAAAIRNQQERKKHKSRATEIIKERIEISQNNADIDQLIHYEDHTSDTGEILGTSVKVKLT